MDMSQVLNKERRRENTPIGDSFCSSAFEEEERRRKPSQRSVCSHVVIASHLPVCVVVSLYTFGEMMMGEGLPSL